MDEASPLCQVCDGAAFPGAPLPLCGPCIVAAHDFAKDCIDLARPDIMATRDACPACGRRALVRLDGVWECAPRIGGCGRKAATIYPDIDLAAAAGIVKSAADTGAAYRDSGPAQVYYIRIGDRIKIGTSLDPAARARSLSLRPEDVMATEPGDYRVEAERHAQFRTLRLHGEWFRAEEPLLTHIAALAS